MKSLMKVVLILKHVTEISADATEKMKLSASTVAALFSKIASTGQRIAMVDMVLLVFQHFHVYRGGGWSQDFGLKIFFSCSLVVVADLSQFPVQSRYDLGIGNGGSKQGRGNQPPYDRRYGPDMEIWYRPRKPHGPAKPRRILSKREADTDFSIDPTSSTRTSIADAAFADAISETLYIYIYIPCAAKWLQTDLNYFRIIYGVADTDFNYLGINYGVTDTDLALLSP